MVSHALKKAITKYGDPKLFIFQTNDLILKKLKKTQNFKKTATLWLDHSHELPNMKIPGYNTRSLTSFLLNSHRIYIIKPL